VEAKPKRRPLRHLSSITSNSIQHSMADQAAPDSSPEAFKASSDWLASSPAAAGLSNSAKLEVESSKSPPLTVIALWSLQTRHHRRTTVS
jgi:hypothetical protein